MSSAPEALGGRIAALALPEAWSLLVFEDGSFRGELSRLGEADGVRLAAGEGMQLELRTGAALPGPVQLLEVGRGKSRTAHSARFADGASGTVLQTVVALGDEPWECGSGLSVELGRGASLTHLFLQRGRDLRLDAEFSAGLEANSNLASRRFCLQGASSRSSLRVELRGEGARAELGGLTFVDGERSAEVDAVVRHVAPRTVSEQLFQALAGGSAKAAFAGTVKVDPGAKGTAARQSSRNILLSRQAAIDSRPQLEIREDDVKCSHGSATGRLDENALRFLRSRGFSVEGARALLVRAFAGEQVGSLPEGGFRTLVEGMLEDLS